MFPPVFLAQAAQDNLDLSKVVTITRSSVRIFLKACVLQGSPGRVPFTHEEASPNFGFLVEGFACLTVFFSLYLKSLQFDKEQMVALTEANEVLKKQIEELQQEATKYVGSGHALAGAGRVRAMWGSPALSTLHRSTKRWPRMSDSKFEAGKAILS